VANAAARIAVDDLDQLGDGMDAIANDVAGTRSATAITSPLTTNTRWSRPG
jgi:hypothetical protein